MTLQDIFQQQILVFHAAIMDNCQRAAAPEKSDAMALRLRNNALALAKLQMAMLATAAPDVVAVPEPEPELIEPQAPEPAPPKPVLTQPERPPPAKPPAPPARTDRILTGDALSRFASRRLEAGESPHEIWRILQEGEPDQPRRNPALPGTGFRSSSG